MLPGRQNFKSLSDEEYLEASGMDFLMKNLLTSVVSHKPEDPYAFSVQYLSKVKSCHHVIGADLSAVFASSHNRRSFIHFLMEAFQGMPLDEDILAIEFQQLLDFVSPELSKKIPIETILCSDVHNNHANVMNTTYKFGYLRVALFFHIIYEEWIEKISQFYIEHATLNCLDIIRVKMLLENFQTSLKYSVCQPSIETIEVAINSVSLNCIDKREITIEELKRAFISTPQITEDVCTVSPFAIPITNKEDLS